MSKALVRSNFLTALALSQKFCARAQFLQDFCAHARAQNVLSAAQVCAHFRILKSWQSIAKH